MKQILQEMQIVEVERFNTIEIDSIQLDMIISETVRLVVINSKQTSKLSMCFQNGRASFLLEQNENDYITDEVIHFLSDKQVLIELKNKNDSINLTECYESYKKSKRKSIGSQIYEHLMNGVFTMLPFVVGGGILIALSFFWGVNSSDPLSSEYNSFAAMLNFIGSSNAFYLMVPVLAGFIALSITGKDGLAPGMIGGLLAITITNNDGANSGFLGGLIAGFLAGYIVLLLKKAFQFLPSTLEGLKTILFYPVFGIGIVGVLMHVINPQMIKIYTALTSYLESMNGSNAVILGIIIGGMMTVDMGGPMNKAAYTFGLAMLEAGQFGIMASVMAGGMVPPLASGLATTIFKNKFTKAEREAGKTAYVLGACFITEGAIPFAVSDPLRVIPSFVLGSAVAGGLTAFFEIASRAPHGGVFVIGLVDGGLTSALLYVLAIATGALVAATSMGLLKKRIL